ncbi:NAD(P)-dependent oxidoreductase [Acinetobacter tibetensis]|uniref:NAD(P)-dependent oxidoreductase n=1 Tax=Acinetobacter tibetensis TaxID=2943497 RepID=A0AAE9S1G0_9GAMM|nr:NAD(P)-dependent oxidoreductase [Acinetobacter tibetensis]USE84831.1 NAD(P)-dependent oxidoreductase [Acinetobacter tibetensis]
MGWHMASHLPKLGLPVYVWNRTTEKAEQHAQQFATQAVSLEHAVQADFIFSCLPTSADVEQLIAEFQPKKGSIWIDCTSGVPDSARKLSQQLEQNQVAYLDAPVSGQTIGAERGTLTVMLGGDEQAYQRALPIISAFAGLVEYVGSSGSGFAVKAVNNVLMATHLWALAEGLTILKQRQVDVSAALNCINHSSGKSTVSDSIMAQKVLNRSFPKTFALNLLQKDIGIGLDLAQQQDSNVPIFESIQALFKEIPKAQAEQIDFTAAVSVLEQWNQTILEA